MRKRGHIDDLRYLDPIVVDGSDGRFPTIPRTLHINLYLAKTCFVSSLHAFLSGYLGEADREYLRTGDYTIEYLPYDWSLNDQADQDAKRRSSVVVARLQEVDPGRGDPIYQAVLLRQAS